MILHGHTRQSIDAMSNADRMLLLHHCGTGAVGPLASGVNAFRLASYIRSLQGTVLSLVKGTRPDKVTIEEGWPELAALVSTPASTLRASVQRWRRRPSPGRLSFTRKRGE